MIRILLALALLSCVPAEALAKGSYEIAKEVARTEQLEKRVINVWWLPVNYWEQVARELKWKEEDVAATRASLAPYHLIAVLDATVKPDKQLAFAEHVSVADKLQVRVGGGEPLPVLRRVDPLVTRKLPELAFPLRTGLGALGPGLRLLLVSNADKDGKPHIDGASAALVRVRYEVEPGKPLEFFWHAPLSSISGARRDPKTAEPLEASWRFNPWTGEKLPER